ncbi:MAG: sugar ABC transporter ATP-binding protein [Actinobacteria bacterium]|nr:sugar ABC transporter ATP-binding protein [Actinomycetota bacterium]
MSYVQIRDISKRFGPVVALDRVSIDVRRGGIHALAGGNGSGKSTLIKILGGVYRGDQGTITVGAHSYDAADATPRHARDAGLRFVHQNAGVFPDMSVAENLIAGRGYPTGPLSTIRWRRLRRYAAEVLERYEIPARPEEQLLGLRPAARMQVAIARCLEEGRTALADAGGPAERVLVLDEPTASLPAHEATELGNALERFAAAGETIIFISHRLDEIFGLADTVSVIRDGKMIGTRSIADLDEDGLIEMMLGRSLDRVFPDHVEEAAAEVVLRAHEVGAGPLGNVNLELRRGEIVGVVGLLGSGRSELLLSIFGAIPRAGLVELDGIPLPALETVAAMEAGVALVPEDRLGEAAFLDQTITENLSVARMSRYFRGGFWRGGVAEREAAEACRQFGVKAASTRSLLSTLSGGNQQKVMLARWMQRDPKVLLLDEPTQGVDVTSRAEIYRIIRDAADAGTGVLVASSDFEEVANLCDRVVVIRDGTIADGAAQPLSAEQLTQMAYGTAPAAKHPSINPTGVART